MCRVYVVALATVAYGAFPSGVPVSPYLTGQNYWYFPPDSAYGTIMNSGVTAVRIGGHTFDEITPLTDAELLHQVDMIRSIGAEPIIQVSRFRTAATAANTVQYINVTHARNVKFWSIGNEPDLGYTGTELQLAAEVAAYIKQLSPAMRDVDPGITIIAPDMAFYSATKYNELLGGSSDITGRDSKGRYYMDCVSFHRYGGTTFTRSDALNDMHSGFESTRVVPLLDRISHANSLQGRTGPSALTWALTEFNITTRNPANNTPEGYGVSSFLNGQFFAEYYRVAMKHRVAFMNTWSMLEGGGNGSEGDLGYLGGTWSSPVPRSSYYHMQMIADYLLPGGYLEGTSSTANVAVLCTSTAAQGLLSVMILNEDTFDHTFSLRMDTGIVVGPGDTKIKVAANLAAEYSGTIGQQSSVVLIFDTTGVLLKRITYSLALYQNNAKPVVETFNQTAAPVFNPAPGAYATAQSVAISSPTSGASIRYTTDGSVPTSISGTVYSAPVSISATTVLKAIAYTSGLADSAVFSGTYTIGPISVPPSPTGLTATAVSSSQINLFWSASSGAASYNVKRATVGGGPYTTIATGVTATSFSNTALLASTTYHYVVSAVNTAGESANSAQASAATLAGATGTTIAFEAESLSYTASGATVSVNSETGASGGSWVQLNASGTSQYIEFTTGSITAGTYSIQLLYKANNNRGQHSFTVDGAPIGNLDQYASAVVWPSATIGNVTFSSNGTHVLRLAVTGKNASSTGYLISADKFTFVAETSQLPLAPTGATATPGNSQVSLSWTASSGATSYNVKRATVGGGPYTAIATGVTATSYTNTGLANGTTYYYVVSAVNANGESANSNEASATPALASTILTFTAVAADDGWVLESTETSNVGGSSDSTATNNSALRAGDNQHDKQYKAIVSFDTSSVPDAATITSVTLKLKRGTVNGTTPFDTHGSCYVDIKAGSGFGGATTLANSDFEATADATQVATMSKPLSDGAWSTGSLNSTGLGYINKTGYTQFRVYFSLDDNDNNGNDFIGWYSGNNGTAGNRPVLEVVYQ